MRPHLGAMDLIIYSDLAGKTRIIPVLVLSILVLLNLIRIRVNFGVSKNQESQEQE